VSYLRVVTTIVISMVPVGLVGQLALVVLVVVLVALVVLVVVLVALVVLVVVLVVQLAPGVTAELALNIMKLLEQVFLKCHQCLDQTTQVLLILLHR
jgi:hypothetical protein